MGRGHLSIFVPEGEKVNAVICQRILATELIPWIERNYAKGTCVFQQDGTPAHTANSTQKFLGDNISFWPKEIRPLSSPDLNVLDYFW